MCGVPVYVRVRPLAEGLWLWAVVPEQAIKEAVRGIGALVAGVTLATMLLAAALAFGALRSLILNPLENLRRATSAISDGHLAVNLSVDRKDEIGDLAKSFEEMGRSLQRSNDQIHRLAYHDGLTGLPNRLLFMEYLQKSLAYAKRSGGCLAVMFLDLDNFKHINDTLVCLVTSSARNSEQL
jgi:HAMP domain-containing protein